MGQLVAALLLAAASAPGGAPAPNAGEAPAAESVFVLADVVRLRAEPSEGAPVVARVRIGTRVAVRERRGDWARVSVGEVEDWIFDGWTRGALLAVAPQTRAALLGRAGSSKGAGRIGWLERAAAIDPGRRETWLSLAEAQAAAGNLARSAQAKALADGGAPGFLAACDGGSAMLVAEWSPGSEPRKLSSEFSLEERNGPLPAEGLAFRRELVRLAEELPAAAWFVPGASRLAGSPFPRPKLLEQPGTCDDTWRSLDVQLGPCSEERRWLATTTPLAPLATQAAELDDRMRTALVARDVTAVDRVEVRRIPGTPALLEVRFAGPARKGGSVFDRAAGAERPIAKRVEGWALFGAGAEPLAYTALTTEDPKSKLPPEHNPETAALGPAGWSLVALRPGVRVAALRYEHGSGGTDGQTWNEWGYYLVTVNAAGEVDLRKLTIYGFGSC
jgi:hypothetical protein